MGLKYSLQNPQKGIIVVGYGGGGIRARDDRM
jgi:hypothetical protein